MSSIRTLVYRAFLLGGVALLTACAGDNTPGRYIASTWLGPKTAKPQDFVVASRPASSDYIPVHSTTPGRTTASKTEDQVKAAEQELDALRGRNVSAGEAAAKAGGTPPPDPALSPAASAKASSKTASGPTKTGKAAASRKPRKPSDAPAGAASANPAQ